jgi:integrase
MCHELSISSTRETIRWLVALMEFLAIRGICRRPYFTPQTPSREDIRNYTHEEAVRSGLPSTQAIEGLGNIYRHAQEPKDQLRSAIVALLIATGLRIGEVLALSWDCEVSEIREGKASYGLRY